MRRAVLRAVIAAALLAGASAGADDTVKIGVVAAESGGFVSAGDTISAAVIDRFELFELSTA